MRNLRPLPLLVVLLVLLSPLAAPARAPERTSGDFHSLIFSGNKTFGEGQLRQAAGLKPGKKFLLFHRKQGMTRLEVEQALDQVTLFYHRQGYFDAEAELLTPHPGEAEIRITEGVLYRIASVEISGWPEKGGEDSARGFLFKNAKVKKGEPYTVAAYQQGQHALVYRLRDSGYPFARVRPSAVVDMSAKTVAISYRVRAGEFCRFGTVTFKGDFNPLDRTILQRALSFRTGETYRQSLVDRSQEALFRLGVFESVLVVPKRKGPPGRVPMVVRLKAGRIHRIRLGVGYASDEGVRGQAGWETLRVNGRLLNLGTEAKWSDIQTTASGYLKRPYFLDRDTTFLSDVAYSRMRQTSFTYRSLQFRGGLYHRFSRNFSGTAYGSLERVLQITPDRLLKNALAEGATDVSTIASLPVSFTYNDTDTPFASLSPTLSAGARTGTPFSPTKGGIYSVVLEPSYVLATHIRFTKTTIEARHYFGLGDDFVLACKLKMGGIFSSASSLEIPVTRRFYAGGANSVRGYAYDNLGPLSNKGVLLGGDGLAEASLELRFPLRENLGGVAFVDAGNATPKAYSLKGANIMSGAGFGARVKTPVGPIGVDVAWKLRKYPLDHSPFMLYFFIGYAF